MAEDTKLRSLAGFEGTTDTVLNDRKFNLVAVCDDAGKLGGVIFGTDVASRISHCTGSSAQAAGDDWPLRHTRETSGDAFSKALLEPAR